MRIEEFRRKFQGNGGRALVAVLSALLLMPADSLLFAQDAQAAQSAPAGDEQEAPKLTNDQLDGLVAPVALYPDPLLAQVLVASTYPLDIVEAQQWLTQNSSLKGDELTKAAEKQQWDASVQAMVLFPDVVKRFSENIKWTTDLGNAFLAQQEDVMDAVQRLRASAKDAGKLESSEQQKVETKTVESKTVIEIQPASTQVVYVPTYNPTVIWGSAYAYPPMYYPPYYPGAGLISFGVGMAVGAAISGGWGWGCGWHGGGNTININNNNNFVRNSNVNNNINRSGNSNWQHNAKGRGGVPYGDKATANKYGGGARGDSMASRQQQARTRQGSAGGAGDRSAGGAGNRGGGSGGMSNRSGGAGGASSRSGGGGASNFSGGQGGNRSSQVGSRNVSPSSRSSSSGAFGGSQSGSHARASSSRGSSSMSSSRGGGGRGGGGGRRR